jgi:hypothetical protein
LTSGVLYAMAIQPVTQQQSMGITYGEPEPVGISG